MRREKSHSKWVKADVAAPNWQVGIPFDHLYKRILITINCCVGCTVLRCPLVARTDAVLPFQIPAPLLTNNHGASYFMTAPFVFSSQSNHILLPGKVRQRAHCTQTLRCLSCSRGMLASLLKALRWAIRSQKKTGYGGPRTVVMATITWSYSQQKTSSRGRERRRPR